MLQVITEELELLCRYLPTLSALHLRVFCVWQIKMENFLNNFLGVRPPPHKLSYLQERLTINYNKSSYILQ